MNKRQIKIILSILLAITLAGVIACEGPTGAEGEQGLEGPQGEQGPEGPAGATNHSNLANLDADDHTQYLLADSVRLARDGFAVRGIISIGTIPVEGQGTRLMWYSGKAAFRAGRVSGGQWDDNNIGRFSVAMGQNTTASGAESAAFGLRTIAATDRSLSIGRFNDANSTADGTLFVVGNGSNGSPSDALVLGTSGDLWIAGNLTEASDRRLKTDIEPLEAEVLGKLAEIHPVRYRFKERTGHPAGDQIGLIAQEVQAHFPELVTKKNDHTLSLSYSKLTAVLLKGLQEQQAQIELQQAEIEKLKRMMRSAK